MSKLDVNDHNFARTAEPTNSSLLAEEASNILTSIRTDNTSLLNQTAKNLPTDFGELEIVAREINSGIKTGGSATVSIAADGSPKLTIDTQSQSDELMMGGIITGLSIDAATSKVTGFKSMDIAAKYPQPDEGDALNTLSKVMQTTGNPVEAIPNNDSVSNILSALPQSELASFVASMPNNVQDEILNSLPSNATQTYWQEVSQPPMQGDGDSQVQTAATSAEEFSTIPHTELADALNILVAKNAPTKTPTPLY